MLPDPTERNVNPFLFQTVIRTLKKLVLALTIHDENVTMAKPVPASITVQTWLAVPFEERVGPKAHRHNELRLSHTPQTAAQHRCAILPATSIHGTSSGSQQLAQHTKTSNVTKKTGRPTTQCGTNLLKPVSICRKPKIHPIPARHPGTTIPQTSRFSPEVSSRSNS